MSFQINAHVVKQTKSLVRWFDVDCVPFEGFRLKLAYVNKRTFERWYQRCSKLVHNPTTKKREQRLDEKKFFREYAENVVLDWDGLTLGDLKKIVAMSGVEGLPDDTVIDCSPENIVALLQNALELDTWISNLVTDPLAFQVDASEEEGEEEVPLEDMDPETAQAQEVERETGN